MNSENGEGFNFRPPDTKEALREHFTFWNPSLEVELPSGFTAMQEKIVEQSNIESAILIGCKKDAIAADADDSDREFYNKILLGFADPRIDDVVQLPEHLRDDILISSARAYAVVDPVVGNAVSDDMLAHNVIRLASKGVPVESLGRIVDAIMDTDVRQGIANGLAES